MLPRQLQQKSEYNCNGLPSRNVEQYKIQIGAAKRSEVEVNVFIIIFIQVKYRYMKNVLEYNN